MSKLHTQPKTPNACGLYRVVFENKYTKFAVCILFFSFLLQPVTMAAASEEGGEITAASPEPEVQVAETEIAAEEPIDEENDDVDASAEDGPVANASEEEPEVIETEDGQIDETGTEEVLAEPLEVEAEDEEVSEEEILQDEDQDENFLNDSATSTQEDQAEVDSGAEEGSASDDVDASLDIATSTATTTESEIVETENEATASTSATTTAQSTENGTGSSQDGEEDNESESAQNQDVATSTENTEDVSKTEDENEDESLESDLTTETGATSSATTTETEIEQNATSSTESAEAGTTTQQVGVPVAVINDTNRHQFGVDECVSVGDGSFYCSEQTEDNAFIEDGIFAAPDSDGDMEIYIRLNGEEAQITHNLVDDASPYYDALSKRIVWHTSKQDRYQIASYDFNTEEITYLTDERYNNMEPVAYGDATLWQAWVGDDWEIMMHKNGSTTQLTDNTLQDVTPHIRGDHILWQTQFTDGWQIAMYDLATEDITYIGEGDGSRIENPRFVLVYDSLSDNGDIQTVGYDFDSGSTFALGHLPAELPQELPEPDQTGETKALIQTKSTEQEIETKEAKNTGTTTPDVKLAATSTAETSHTLDLSTTTPKVSEETASTTVHIPDVVVEPQTATTTEAAATTTHAIQDVVIPPVGATSTEEVG